MEIRWEEGDIRHNLEAYGKHSGNRFHVLKLSPRDDRNEYFSIVLIRKHEETGNEAIDVELNCADAKHVANHLTNKYAVPMALMKEASNA